MTQTLMLGEFLQVGFSLIEEVNEERLNVERNTFIGHFGDGFVECVSCGLLRSTIPGVCQFFIISVTRGIAVQTRLNGWRSGLAGNSRRPNEHCIRREF